jgi:enoyl-CoA hydratase
VKYKELIVEKEEGVSKVILNRPEARNALTPVLLSELANVLEVLQKEKDVRVVFLKGAGKSFCAGLDLKYTSGILEGRIDELYRDIIPYGARICDQIENLDKPVIAAVHGNAIAGGFILAYFCDLIIASEDARFGDAHATWGLVPGWQEPQRLARSIGLRRAKQFFLTNEIISAEEAREIGLVWKVVPNGKIDEAIREWGEKFVKLSSESLRMIKQQFKSVMKADWQTILDIDSLIRQNLLGGFCTPDALERLKSFVNKGKN